MLLTPSLLFRCLTAFAVSLSLLLSLPAVSTDAQAQGFFERLFGKKNHHQAQEPSPEELARARARAAQPKVFQPIVPHILLAGGKVFPITVIGDSLAGDLFTGVSDNLRGHQNVTLSKVIRAGVGLVRSDHYDLVQAVLDGTREITPRVAIIMTGINDRQRFPPSAFTGKQPAKPPVFSSAVWQQMYTARVDRLLKPLRNRNVAVYWVGLPIVRDREHAQDNAYLNDVIRERVEQAGGKFIDIWEAFASETGAYTRLGPDLKGSNRRLRTKDGVHFTRSGAQKLAHFAVKEILADFGTSTLNQPNGPGLSAGAAPAQPAAGLVVKPLTTAGIQGFAQPGGQRLARNAPPAPPPYVRALEWGDALPAVKGRADDFAWPRR